MEGAGPISIDVARKLMGDASCFYRVLTDPVTNKPLDCAPQQYRLTQAMKVMLRIRDEYCQFPGCLIKAISCQTDHVKAFEHGGPTILDNLENLCRAHHQLKHFKDDRTRTGEYRLDQGPERAAVRLRGWTPTPIENGGVAWTSPRGHYHPPETTDTHVPAYPKWVKKHIIQNLSSRTFDSQITDDSVVLDHVGGFADTRPPAWESEEGCGGQQLPEPPPGAFADDLEFESMVWESITRRGVEDPRLGLPD